MQQQDVKALGVITSETQKDWHSINKISEMLHYVAVLEIGREVPFWLCNRI